MVWSCRLHSGFVVVVGSVQPLRTGQRLKTHTEMNSKQTGRINGDLDLQALDDA